MLSHGTERTGGGRMQAPQWPVSAGCMVQRAGEWTVREGIEAEEDRWRGLIGTWFCRLMIVKYVDVSDN